MYAEQHEGTCPSYLQNPHGKTLNISFIGLPPYITYNPVGGSEILVTNMLAKKLGFIPKFIPAKSWDIFEINQTKYGMVHQVRLIVGCSKVDEQVLQYVYFGFISYSNTKF